MGKTRIFLAYSSFVALGFFTIFTPIFLYRKRKQLSEKSFDDKYGSLILDLKTKNFSSKLF